MAKSFHLRIPAQLLVMFLVLAAGGAYLLFGQQIASEQSDWPWKMVTESKVFLNGEPVGKLSDPSPIKDKINRVRVQGMQKGLIGEFDMPNVLVVADRRICFAKLADLIFSIQEGTGNVVLVSNSSLDRVPAGQKPNPLALIATTEGVDPNKARSLAGLSNAEVASAGNEVFLGIEGDPLIIRAARTYANSIEISSDGRFYFNEQTGSRESIANGIVSNANAVSTQMILANYARSSSNATLPPLPLKQRPIARPEIKAAVAAAIGEQTVDPMINVIISEKAPYDCVLQLMDAIGDPKVKISFTIRTFSKK